MPKKTIVIDLGGSVLSPKMGEINLKFLNGFKNILQKEKRYKRFVVVIGGGGLCRAYQDMAREASIKKDRDLDWVGIRSTQLNAEFLRVFLGKIAFPELVISQDQKINWQTGVLISGGWCPGNSTDYIAMELAKKYQAEKVIIGTNIEYLYDSDPRKNPKAKKILRIGWKDFYKMANRRWEPGMNTPLDPKAAKVGCQDKMPVLFLNGNNLPNLIKAIRGKNFEGTIIS